MSDPKAKSQNAKATDRLPPHAPEAEQGVLGCLLLAPATSMDACLEQFGGDGVSVFYDLRHQVIFDTIKGMYDKGQPVEVMTLHQRLKDRNLLEEVGGIGYVAGLPDLVPSAANIGFYLETVWQKHLLRRTLATCTEIASWVWDCEGQAETVLAKAQRDILKLGEESTGQREELLKAALLRVIEDMETHYIRGRAQMRGLSTGLEYVDKLLCGLGGKHGNYIVLSARPGFGKTSLAVQIACHAAMDFEWWEPVLEGGKPVIETLEDGKERVKATLRKGIPVGIFSLEMARDALAERILFQRAQGDMQRWRTGFATNADLVALTLPTAALAKAGIWIDDEGRCTIDSLRAKARRMTRQYGIKLFVIDYIQLMRAGGKRFRDDRVQELSEISGEIQALGKELKVPIIVLAQMNRDFEKDPNRKPRLSDLKDCGSIEQDADVVGFLYRPKLRDKDEEVYDRAMTNKYGTDWSQRPERVDLLVAKNRYGPTGVCQLLFQKSCTRFLDWVRWLKENGEFEPSTGDRGLPSNEEMDL